MYATLRKRLIEVFTIVIKHIEEGKCDNMTFEQYNKIIECLETIIDIEQKKMKRIWFFRYF